MIYSLFVKKKKLYRIYKIYGYSVINVKAGTAEANRKATPIRKTHK